MSIGIWQVILILVIVLIIFGAGRLPSVMGDVAKGVRNFKAGLKEGETPKDEEPRQLHAEPAGPAASAASPGATAAAASRSDDTAKH